MQRRARNAEAAGKLVTKEKLLETMKLAGMTVSENTAISEIETEDRWGVTCHVVYFSWHDVIFYSDGKLRKLSLIN